jgi:hypothetical protein
MRRWNIILNQKFDDLRKIPRLLVFGIGMFICLCFFVILQVFWSHAWGLAVEIIFLATIGSFRLWYLYSLPK